MGFGRNFARKSPPKWTAPVPDIVCKEQACVLLEEDTVEKSYTHSLFTDCSTFGSKNKLLGSRSEVWKTGNREVFMVQVGIGSKDLVRLARLERFELADSGFLSPF